MSSRKTVLDAIASALLASTGIQSVAEFAESFAEMQGKDFPRVNLIDTVVDRDRISFPATTTLDDMEALMSLEVRGTVREFNNVTAGLADTLIDDVESTLITSTGVAAVVKDIYPVTDATDEGVQKDYAQFTQGWEVVYHYNHTNP